MEDSAHVFDFRVPLSSIDIGGVIYNGNYLDIYNQARDEYLRDIGFPYINLVKDLKCHFSVVEINIKYKKPVHYDELIEVFTKVEKIGRTSLVFEQIIYKDNRQKLCNTAKSILVCTNSSHKSEPLPEELKAAIKLYQAKGKS